VVGEVRLLGSQPWPIGRCVRACVCVYVCVCACVCVRVDRGVGGLSCLESIELQQWRLLQQAPGQRACLDQNARLRRLPNAQVHAGNADITSSPPSPRRAGSYELMLGCAHADITLTLTFIQVLTLAPPLPPLAGLGAVS